MDALRDRWNADALQTHLHQLWPGLRVWIAPTLASTNSALVEAARNTGIDARTVAGRVEHDDGSPPCLCVAEIQTQGRGRLGRHWTSHDRATPGGRAGASLTFSLSVALNPASWSGLSLALGVAIAEALEPAPHPVDRPLRVRLKWPNDLWLDDAGAPAGGRKLGGILIETVMGPQGRVAVVGVGLNVQPLVVPDASTGVAAWSEVEPAATAAQVLQRVAPAVASALRQFEDRGLAPFLTGFKARDALLGRAVRTTLAEAPQGQAEGIDTQGALQLRLPDGRLIALHGSEVSVRPRGPDGSEWA